MGRGVGGLAYMGPPRNGVIWGFKLDMSFHRSNRHLFADHQPLHFFTQVVMPPKTFLVGLNLRPMGNMWNVVNGGPLHSGSIGAPSEKIMAYKYPLELHSSPKLPNTPTLHILCLPSILSAWFQPALLVIDIDIDDFWVFGKLTLVLTFTCFNVNGETASHIRVMHPWILTRIKQIMNQSTLKRC